MTVYADKTCAQCGASFSPTSGRARYCESCRTPKLERERVADRVQRHRLAKRGLDGANRYSPSDGPGTPNGYSVSAGHGVDKVGHIETAGPAGPPPVGYVWVRRSDGAVVRFYLPPERCES